MTSGHKGRTGRRERKGNEKAGRFPLAAHGVFAPMLGLWGALLGGMVVVVLPSHLVHAALSRTLIGTWSIDPQPLAAWIAATFLGLLLFTVALVMHSRARRAIGAPSVLRMAARQVTPINPMRDLGSLRLDDPVEATPFAAPAWRDSDVAEPEVTPEPAPVAAGPEPRELDLAEFAELPGRNAVWIEEMPPAPEPAPRPVEVAAPAMPEPQADPVADIRARRLRAVAPLPAVPGGAALARLREVPASELSLAEMVERFAGALHEHRSNPPELRPGGGADLAAREAALAEALKALAALSGETRPAPRLPQRDDPLRAALAQLQPQAERSRGAA